MQMVLRISFLRVFFYLLIVVDETVSFVTAASAVDLIITSESSEARTLSILTDAISTVVVLTLDVDNVCFDPDVDVPAPLLSSIFESSGELGDSVDGNLFKAFRCLNLRMLRPRNNCLRGNRDT